MQYLIYSKTQDDLCRKAGMSLTNYRSPSGELIPFSEHNKTGKSNFFDAEVVAELPDDTILDSTPDKLRPDNPGRVADDRVQHILRLQI